MAFASTPTPSCLLLAATLASGCGARSSFEDTVGSGGEAQGGAEPAVGAGGLGAGGAGAQGGAVGTGGAETTSCTLTMPSEPMQPYAGQVNYGRPNVAVRSTPGGGEVLLQMWQSEHHGRTTRELTAAGVGDVILPLEELDNDASRSDMLAATATPGTLATLYPKSSVDELALQRFTFDGATGPVMTLPLDVGPVALQGHLAVADGPGGAEHLVTYLLFTPVGDGPQLEPTVVLLDDSGQPTHGPVSLEPPLGFTGFGRDASSIWVDDHVLSVVVQPDCGQDCEPYVAVHRLTPAAGGQLAHVPVWSDDAPDAPSAALATRDGRVWLAVFDGMSEPAELRLWELAPDGSVLAGPVTVDTGHAPEAPSGLPLGWGGSGLQLTATPWGLVVSEMKLTDEVEMAGGPVAELGFIHLTHELQVVSSPIILPILSPAQQSPLRVAAIEDGLLAVWSARGFPEDAPLGTNDGDLIHVARLYCE